MNGRPANIQKTTRPDSISLDAWTQLSKKQEEENIADWSIVFAKLQTDRRNIGICEAQADHEDYLKVTADARLKLEKDVALGMRVFC